MNKYTSLSLTLLIPLLIGAVLTMLFDAPHTQAAAQNVLVVDTLNDENDGSCIDGDCSLRDAIATAQIEDTISFSVSGTIDISTLGQLTINNVLTIDGGNAITITGNNASRIIKLTGGALTLNGLTLADGFPTTLDCATGGQICGGAISTHSGTALTVTNSIFDGNHADRGGAIHTFFNTLHIDNTTFKNNSADDQGGVLMVTFFSDLTITNSHFEDNSSNQSIGGALFLDVISATISNTIFTDNSATGGGAIFVSGGDTSIYNSLIYDNFAQNRGGGIDLGSGNHLIQNSTISNNTANDEGGGLFNRGTTSILNSTIANNRARNSGAGILSSYSSNLVTALTNTMVVDNIIMLGGFAEDVALFSTNIDTFNSGGNNMVGAIGADITTFSPITDIINITSTQLGPLQDNGGPTHSHALLSDSLAINAGNPSACPAIDQRGVSRPQGAGCDIGAFELDQFLLNVAIIGSGMGTVTSAPAGISCTSDCSENFSADSMVTLTATSGQNSSFAGWSGACSGTAVCTITLDESKDVTATFLLDTQYIYLPLITAP